MNSTQRSRHLASCLISTGALFLLLLASKEGSAFGACAEATGPGCGTNPFDESLGRDSFQSCEA